VLDTYAAATDDWTRSALIAAATEQAPAYLTEALMSDRPQVLADFVTGVLPAALPAHAARLIVASAAAGPGAAPLKTSIVRAVAKAEGGPVAADAETMQALQTLLDDPATRAAALPIVARWDKAGVMRAKADSYAQLMLHDVTDAAAADDRRIDAAASLLAVPARRSQVLAAIEPMLADATVSPALKGRLVIALGENAGADADTVMVSALARTNSTIVFDQLLKRPESSLALLAAMKDGRVTTANLGPANVARLRTHPNRQVAVQAAALLDTLSPGAKAKGDVIAALLPEIEKPGDAAKGRALFAGTCASCHKLGDLGKIEVGPPLSGMGTHGRAELLGHIVDPNREVDPSFWQWNVTTKKGETLAGVIASENASTLTLRSPAGDVELKK
jgi:putative heme-binding domain-containing protein